MLLLCLKQSPLFRQDFTKSPWGFRHSCQVFSSIEVLERGFELVQLFVALSEVSVQHDQLGGIAVRSLFAEVQSILVVFDGFVVVP